MFLQNNLDENSSLQADEIKALSAIFGKDFKSEDNNAFSIKIYNSLGNEVFVKFMLPEDYPLYSPPVYQISAPWMSRQAKQRLYTKMEEIYKKNVGMSMIYFWIDDMKHFIEDPTIHKSNKKAETNCKSSNLGDIALNKEKDDSLLTIEHGESIVDRKSIFQAHLARIVAKSQVQQVLDKLKEISKITSAKHNVYAYRILLENGSIIEDYDDDGERKAGIGLLQLLQIKNLSNVLIIVTRWYGGINLGNERFRHYGHAARNLINKLGLSQDEKKPPSRHKKRSSLDRDLLLKVDSEELRASMPVPDSNSTPVDRKPEC